MSADSVTAQLNAIVRLRKLRRDRARRMEREQQEALARAVDEERVSEVELSQRSQEQASLNSAPAASTMTAQELCTLVQHSHQAEQAVQRAWMTLTRMRFETQLARMTLDEALKFAHEQSARYQKALEWRVLL